MILHKAWAKFECKDLQENDTHYLLSGVATTPTPDRSEDVVEPMGAEYALPLAFLWQHDGLAPIGEVYDARPSAKGIPVNIRIPKVSSPGTLKDRIDEAVQSITHKLVRGLSIGFVPVESSYIEATGGYRFTKWKWLELSAVTIPANEEATITNVKRFDAPRTEGARPRVALSLKGSAPHEAEPPAFSPAQRKAMDFFATVIAAAVDPLQKRVGALESQMRERKYLGVWDRGAYKAENSVTHKGSVWIALEETSSEPGTDDSWQLAVKRGRDAR